MSSLTLIVAVAVKPRIGILEYLFLSISRWR